MRLGRKECAAAAVMLIALSATLLVLVKPRNADALSGVPNDPTDVALASSVFNACDPGTGLPTVPASVRVELSGAAADGNPVGSPMSPISVKLAVVPAGTSATTFPATLRPTAVVMTGTNIKVWLPDANVDPALSELMLQADGYSPEVVPFAPASCDPALTPAGADFGLASIPSDPTALRDPSVTACGTGPNAVLRFTLTNAATDVSTFSAASGMSELDYGVFVFDDSATPTVVGSTIAPFTVTDPVGAPNIVPATLDLTGIVIPAVGSLAGYTVVVVAPDGQVSSRPLLDINNNPIDCTPTTSTSPTTSATPPPSDTTTASDQTTPPPTSASASEPITPTSPSISDSSTSSQPTSPVTSPVVPTSTAIKSSPASPSTSEFPATSTSTSKASAVPLSSGGSSAAPTVRPILSASNGGTAIAGDTSHTVEILRWHRDAAVVVGFDVVAIFSLVGATVWSARRR